MPPGLVVPRVITPHPSTPAPTLSVQSISLPSNSPPKSIHPQLNINPLTSTQVRIHALSQEITITKTSTLVLQTPNHHKPNPLPPHPPSSCLVVWTIPPIHPITCKTNPWTETVLSMIPVTSNPLPRTNLSTKTPAHLQLAMKVTSPLSVNEASIRIGGRRPVRGSIRVLGLRRGKGTATRWA